MKLDLPIRAALVQQPLKTRELLYMQFDIESEVAHLRVENGLRLPLSENWLTVTELLTMNKSIKRVSSHYSIVKNMVELEGFLDIRTVAG